MPLRDWALCLVPRGCAIEGRGVMAVELSPSGRVPGGPTRKGVPKSGHGAGRGMEARKGTACPRKDERRRSGLPGDRVGGRERQT